MPDHDTPTPTPTPTPSSPPRARQGLRLDGDDLAPERGGIGAVVDYRGDVMVTRRETGETVPGYVFDCVAPNDPARAAVRLLPSDGGSAITIPLADIAAIEITGRDTAEGKSFERWIQRYVEKKLAGEEASIESEPLGEG